MWPPPILAPPPVLRLGTVFPTGHQILDLRAGSTSRTKTAAFNENSPTSLAVKQARIDLEALLLSGKFGDIQLGSSREVTLSHLGPPDDFSSESTQENAEIWKYGTMEVYFQDHSADQLFSDAEPIFRSTRRIRYHNSPFTRFGLDEFCSFYRRHGIRVELFKSKYDDDILNLQMPDQPIKASFRTRNSHLLDSFSVSIFNDRRGF